MEPILELATRITSHLWFLHARYPEKTSLAGISNEADLDEVCRVHDYSSLQDLLDLADMKRDGEWDPKDPIREFYETPKSQYEGFTGWRPTNLYQSTKQLFEAFKGMRDDYQGWISKTDEEKIGLASDRALAVLHKRVQKLEESGALSAISLTPRVRVSEPRVEGDPAAEKTNETPVESIPREKLLTREELFENVTGWLISLTAHRDTHQHLCALARVFIPSKKDESSRTSSNATCVPNFFMLDGIDKCAQQVRARESGTRSSGYASWWVKARADSSKSDQVLCLLLNSRRLRRLCECLGVPIPFSMVYSAELEEIAHSRLLRLRNLDPSALTLSEVLTEAGMDDKPGTCQKRAFDSCLLGLALSGGGIRSATFALGLLEGMADRNILPYVDILSTVSGGGYIGSWLISWIKRRGSLDSVQQSLRGNATMFSAGDDCTDQNVSKKDAKLPKPFGWLTRNTDPHADHVRPIRILRQYARYLAPQAGLFSADTWTIAATWMRNTLLNLLVLVSLLGVVLLLPRIVILAIVDLRHFIWVFAPPSPNIPGPVTVSEGRGLEFAIIIAGLPLIWACYRIGKNLSTFVQYPSEKTAGRYDDSAVARNILAFVVLGVLLEVTLLWWYPRERVDLWFVAFGFGLVAMIGMVFIWWLMPDAREGKAKEKSLPLLKRLGASLGWRIALVAGIGLGACLFELLYLLVNIFGTNTLKGLWLSASVGFAVMLTSVICVLVLFIGLYGTDMYDDQREWWSRLGAWLGIALTVWLAICAICFFMPLWIAMWGLKVAAAGGIGWATITGLGAKLAFSPRSGKNGEDGEQNMMSRLLLRIAPSVFVIGLLSLVSFGLFWLVDSVPRVSWLWWLLDPRAAQQLVPRDLPVFERMVNQYWAMMAPGSAAPLLLVVLFFGFCLLMAWRVDVNEFSMHNFYKNRLVRAYLGASRARAHRVPNAFTGFDLEDDIRLARFQYSDRTQPRDMVIGCKPSYSGPFPIINTALNITQGADLGLQERKAESFAFTPLWSGFDFARRQAAKKQTNLSEYGFQRTEDFGEPENHGVFLGTAMAISGAAFSSNAGFHTSPSLAFLLTVFGVRLGWWAGNPRLASWRSRSPGLGLLYLTKELTARTDSGSKFVLLTDGGHFENMGLYELIRRHCRFIIVSDAEEDEKFKLEGIGGAVRKCREDFGVVIDLNLKALQPIGDPAVSKLHYSLGNIIYPGEQGCGKLIYIKSSVTGDEPVDVIEFRKRHSEFPHTSTANQFFDESHFESYRALGQHVARDVFTDDMGLVGSGSEICDAVSALFRNVEISWQARLTTEKKKLEVAVSMVHSFFDGAQL